MPSGTFLIRIVSLNALEGRIGHLVVLDAEKGHSIDTVECLGLENQLVVLKDCFGGSCGSVEMAEVKELEMKPVGKGKQNRRNTGKAMCGNRTKAVTVEHEFVYRRTKRMRVVEDGSK